MGNETQLALFEENPSDYPSTSGGSDGGFLDEVAPSGRDRERELEDEGRRKAAGAYYTPPDVVDHLLAKTLQPIIDRRKDEGAGAIGRIRVLDPACGTGNFLIAAGQRIKDALVAVGLHQADAARIAFGACVAGVDTDSEAVEICRLRLSAEAVQDDVRVPITAHVICADALLAPLETSNTLFKEPRAFFWDQFLKELDASGNGFDLVIGNPPFLSQLSSETSRASEYSRRLAARFGDAVSGYTDPAALFLLLSTELVRRDGGTAALLQPLSLLSTRDATTIRQAIVGRASLTAIWFPNDRVFEAAVDVCAPIFTADGNEGVTQILINRDFTVHGEAESPTSSDGTWSSLLASAMGIPDRHIGESGRCFGDEATATADFRDQYYGLAPHVVDLEGADEVQFPRLVTTGLIDPAQILWGQRATKFNKKSYLHPRVPVSDLDDSLSEWASRRLVPKILVATQTKVLEAWVDLEGHTLPSVPLITVMAPTTRLWHLAAALSSPAVTMIAARRHLGAALSATALKLSAKDVLALPLPDSCDAWDEAATAFKVASETTSAERRREFLVESGRLMCDAYGVGGDDDLMRWWIDRLPRVGHRS